MARKSFLDNPALQFITDQGTAQENNCAEPIMPSAEAAPEGYKLNPAYIEKKTRRLQLVLQPSLYNKVKAMADEAGKSVNDLIHTILEEATKGE